MSKQIAWQSLSVFNSGRTQMMNATIKAAISNDELVAMRAELTRLEEACNEAWKSSKMGPQEALAYDVLYFKKAQVSSAYHGKVLDLIKATDV
jgi:hypothetical protein